MPWTGASFGKHNHSLSGGQADHAARMANAILKRTGSERIAIATANKFFERHDDGGEVGGSEPLDMTNRYNTQLSPADEAKYQAWAGTTGRQNDAFDYDLRGAWKSGAATSANGHLPDTFKKPNHPTFSNQSQYHGVDGYQGGVWGGGQNDQPWSFTPSETNVKMHSAPGLQRYFQQREPESLLIMQGHAGGGGILHRDYGGDVGGLQPSNQTANPMVQGMIQRYASMPPEKLQELSAMLGGTPQGQIVQRVLAQKRAMPQAQAPVAPAMPQQQRRGGATARRDMGGGMSLGTLDPSWARGELRSADSGAGATGYLHGPTSGRADAILTTAPAGSYVIPADVISGLGSGNSLAGAAVMQRILSTGPGGIPLPRSSGHTSMPRPPAAPREAKGGAVPGQDQTPVALSHGEFVVDPDHVAHWGGGDQKKGHAIFDIFVQKMRKHIIETMKKLPGPVGAKKQA